MKRNAIIAASIVAGLCFSAGAFAADLPGIAVYATQMNLKSRAEGNLINYGKAFQVTLENRSAENIALDKTCLKGFAPGGVEYPVARVDSQLLKGVIKPQKRTTGTIVFSAADTSVFNIDLVRISYDCQKPVK